MKKSFKEKLAAYGGLSTAFVLAGNHEAEAQVIHVDVNPDQTFEATFLADTDDIGYYSATAGYYNTGRDNTLAVFIDPDNTASPIRTGSYSDYNSLQEEVRINLWAGVAGRYYVTAFTSTFSSYPSDGYFVPQFLGASAQIGLYGSFLAAIDMNNPSNTAPSSFVPRNMDMNDIVSSGQPVVSSYYTMGAQGYRFQTSTTNSGAVWNSGNFQDGSNNPSDVTGFIGVKFQVGGEIKNGWIRVRLETGYDLAPTPATNPRDQISARDNRSAFSRLTIMDYAYQDDEDLPIFAGQMVDSPIPTMGQWGLIILNFMLIIFGMIAVKNKSGFTIRKKT